MITIKEEFVGCDKIGRAIAAAGWEVLGMWLAMKAYAAEKLTDGFVPDEDVERLRGAPKSPRKALKALVECGRVDPGGERGAGLVDPAKLGWQLHNYDDHASSSTEQELRKEKARERKRKWRAEQAKLLADMQTGQSRGTVPSDVTGRDAGQSRGTKRDTPAQAGTPPHVYARTPAPAQPSPAQSGSLATTPQGTEPLADSEPEVAAAAGESPKVPCPSALRLTAAQRATLVTALIPDWAIDPLEQQFRVNHTADPSDLRTLVAWRKCLGIYVSATWNDPSKRPPAPGAAPTRPAYPLRNAPRQPNAHDHLDDEAHAKAMGATLE